MASEAQTAKDTGAPAGGDDAVQGTLPLFYQRPRPLRLKEHADLAIKPVPDYSFAARATALPLMMGEFPAAAKDYPILFSRGNPPIPVALVGVFKDRNLFVGEDGAWRQGHYVPAYVRRYPFLLTEDQASKRRVLCVDEDAPVLTRGEGQRLVEEGKPSELAQRALRLCEMYAADQERTRLFMQAVAEHDLLVTKQAGVALVTGQKLLLRDFSVIDPEKFEALSDELFLEWRKKGWLYPVYSHFLSGQNWQRLADLAAVGGVPGAPAPAEANAEAKT